MISKTALLTSYLFALGAAGVSAQGGPNDTIWTPLFNGKDLNDWDVKIRFQQLNMDPNQTFRVVAGNLEVNYDKYSDFGADPNEKFGHIGYKVRPYSYYVIRAEYQFFGDQVKLGPGWALQNNGLMLHSQSAASMGLNQNFPISLEAQLLGPRNGSSTMNLCTPGTAFNNITGGQNTSHCVNAIDSDKKPEPAWMQVEAVLLADSLITFKVAGKKVFSFTKPVEYQGSVDGNTVSITNNKPLKEGYILLQAESHPTRFRKIEVANLVGCKTQGASNYKAYYVRHDQTSCNTVSIVGQASPLSKAWVFNAASMKLSIDLDVGYSVRISDLSGRIQLKKEGFGKASYDVGFLKANEIYFLTLSAHGQAQTRKLIVGR